MPTDFNALPMMVDRILNELQTIRNTVSKLEKKDEITKFITLQKAIKFLADQGFEMSPSKLYKLCQAKRIPYKKFGNRLVFESELLLQWAEQQLKRR